MQQEPITKCLPSQALFLSLYLHPYAKKLMNTYTYLLHKTMLQGNE